MIIFIYDTIDKVPFEGPFESFGSYQEGIFSNKEPFDKQTVETLLKDINIEDETAIFYVPSEIKAPFKHLVESRFSETAWNERKPTHEETY